MFWRSFAGFAGKRLRWAVGLQVAIGVFEGSSLLMLVPLLHALGLGGSGMSTALGGFSLARLGDTPRESLAGILAIFVALKAAQAGLKAYSSTVNLRLETDFVCFLRERFYRATMQATWLFLVRQRSAELSQALLGEIPAVGSVVRQSLLLASICLLATAQLVIALILSPAMTAFVLAAGGVIGLGLRRLRRRSEAMSQLGYGKRTEMAATVAEHLAGMKIAKGHGRETQHFTHFQRAMREIAEHVVRMQRIGALMGVWLEVGAVVALSGFVYFAGSRVGVAELAVLAYVFTRLLGQATALQSVWHEISVALPSFAQTERLRERLVEAAEPAVPASVAPLALSEGVRLENVSFRYEAAQPSVALSAVDLAIPARAVVALCGHSGAGKSTVADLLLGLLSPSSGRVLIDGVELSGEPLHRWRRSVGYVPQETFLFHETIRANLLWAQPDATEAELRVALRAAAAEEFVDRLPRGLDTVVGDRGVRLSGGERQRIALARALLGRPTLLLLDEATSALDPQNERLVRDAIERLHGELTIVLIAHRLSTVRMADRIVVLESGRVVETGAWDELCNRERGAFRRLVDADTQG